MIKTIMQSPLSMYSNLILLREDKFHAWISINYANPDDLVVVAGEFDIDCTK
jgi:hypothetical protein